MSLEERCIEAFGEAQRQAGFHDFLEDRVALVDRREGRVESWVVGGGEAMHMVTVDWRRVSDGVLTVTCDCPTFLTDGRCHHLWATLLTLDQELGDTLVPGFEALALVAAEPRASPSPPVALPPGSWRQQLSAVADLQRALLRARHADAREAETGEQRLAWYRLDLSASESAGRLTLEILTTQGEGALRPPSPQGPRAATLTEPEDRWLVELLSAFPGSGGSPRAWLPPVLFETVLPRLCATERCGWQPRPSSSAGTLQPLAWQGGAPWRFVLEVRPVPPGETLRLAGRLRREGEERSLREPLLLLPAARLVVFPDRIGWLDSVGDEPWISVLRQVGGILVPTPEREALERALADLPRPPDPFPSLPRGEG